MKTQRRYLFSPGVLISAFILAAGVFASAQSVIDNRTRKEGFSVTRESTLEVENKYGTILIVPWQKDSVQVITDIHLEAKNSSKMRKLKNDIRITTSSTRNYILVQTIIGDGSSKLASELRTLSNTLSSHSSVEINYTIYLPEYLNLVLTNKFGDIYIDDIHGDVDISLSNGALKANNFSNSAEIELVFAKGKIRHLGNASLNMSYSELQLGSAEQLDFSGRSSELQIDTAGVIKIDSRRDKIILGEVEYLYGNGSFTDVTISDFIREADCNMKYGTLTIESIQPDFSRINVDSDYTDITLHFPSGSNFAVDILHSEKAIVNLPVKNAAFDIRHTGDDFVTVEGDVGGGSLNRQLSIKAVNRCYINITTR